MAAKDELGRQGEAVAARFLEKKAFTIVDRNWRCRAGEIDIVALDGRTLVVVEVKTRRSLAFGHPFEGVTDAKLARLHHLAGQWRLAHPAVRAGAARIDLVGVLMEPGGPARVEHLEGAA